MAFQYPTFEYEDVIIPKEVMEHPKLNKSAKLVYGILSSWDVPYITNRQLSEVVGINMNGIKKAIKQLKDAQLVEYHTKPIPPEKPYSKPGVIRTLKVVKL